MSTDNPFSTVSSSMSTLKWLNKPKKAILLDITGVLYESGTTVAIPGSVQAIQKIRQAKIPFRLITNETQNSTEQLLHKLSNFGYDFKRQEIITPVMICRSYLHKNNLRPHLLVHTKIEPEFQEFNCSQPNCVVVGDADTSFTYERMNECFKILMKLKQDRQELNNENLLITLGRNKFYRHKGELKMDIGGFTTALEYCTDLKAKLIGKPSPEYFQAAMDSIKNEQIPNLSKDDILMIGDDILGDVKGAQDFGINGILVRTGKYIPSNENHPLVKPDAIVDNLEQAINLIIDQQNK